MVNKYKLYSMIAAFAACVFIVTPSAAAQTTTDGTSPQLHAWFELEYAREATFLSVSKPHRDQIVRIARALDNGQLSVTDASSRINALLSSPEKASVLQVEQSFLAVWNDIFPKTAVQPSKLLFGPQVPFGAANFLLLLYAEPH